ncbi:hypothetical protein BCD67_06050 [Oscillatoriales cyanobacterium USR001]|nr:hypothetical protein BCD67_06050 [Oscillatoriales cyanobacterium USR001]
MSITEIIPTIQELSHSDKLLLLHFLMTELLKDSGLVPLETQGITGSQGLYDSFDAAVVLAQALAEEKVTTYG